MPSTKRTKEKNPAHKYVHTKQEVGDDGKIFSIHSCMFCKNYQAEKPRLKINRFAEHFIGEHWDVMAIKQMVVCMSQTLVGLLERTHGTHRQLRLEQKKQRLPTIPI